jgi:hypothetical protein
VPFGVLGVLAPAGAAALLAAGLWARSRWQPQRALRRVATWDCGYVDASSPRLQYSAASFAQLAALVLRWTVRERASRPAPLELFPGPRTFAPGAAEPLLHGVLWPLCRALADRCSALRFLQHGKLQIYLLYILVVLCLLLAWSALVNWSRP